MPLDENIKKNIVDSLYWDDRVDASTIDADVSDGKVILKGTAPSYFAKTAAAENAWTVNGVKNVENEIKVTYPSMVDILTDDEIKISLENMFLWDPDIPEKNIDVKADGGIVTLSGHVDKLWKKFYAERKAIGISGIISVINEIIVTPEEDVVDETIGEDVIKAIKRSTTIDVNKINVEVKSGEVTLSGEVPTWYDYRRVYDAALYTPGVTRIIDNLLISVTP